MPFDRMGPMFVRTPTQIWLICQVGDGARMTPWSLHTEWPYSLLKNGVTEKDKLTNILTPFSTDLESACLFKYNGDKGWVMELHDTCPSYRVDFCRFRLITEGYVVHSDIINISGNAVKPMGKLTPFPWPALWESANPGLSRQKLHGLYQCTSYISGFPFIVSYTAVIPKLPIN